MNEETSQAIVGDAVAAALEKPGRKRRSFFRGKKAGEGRPPFTHCEDCGAELHGRYCSVCGQVAVDYHRSFRHVIADVAESFLNWDSKFLKTFGVTAQREIEKAVRDAVLKGQLKDNPSLPAKAVVTVDGIDLRFEIESDIKLA